jgi:hypothetical protein
LTPKAHFAVDLDYRNALVELFTKGRIVVDIDHRRIQTALQEQRFCVIAQMAAFARVKDHVHRGPLETVF